ncbi:MAG: hypothetical protein RIR18_1595 [Pseudomonadota bacterium]|jgi:hypothetical protein
MTIATTISLLPTPPSRANSPAEFETKSDALFVALPNLVSEVNRLVPEINQATTAINSSKQAAASSEQSSWDAAAQAGQKLLLATQQAQLATTNGAEQVGLATAQAVISTQKAALATDKATAAQTALSSIAQLINLFGDRYLGPHAADPLKDNDGDPLQVGAVYINTTSGVIRFYCASGWVQGISVIAGVSALNGLQGDLALKTINGQPLTGAGDIPITVDTVVGLAQVVDNLVSTRLNQMQQQLNTMSSLVYAGL